jgi:hypothetical protein
MQRIHRFFSMLVAAGAATGLFSESLAVPYASGVRPTGGGMWEFVLNEAADNVTITRNGGNVLNLGARPAGRHTFNLSTFTTFDIAVSNDTPAGWTWINDTATLWDDFERPTGLAVNNIPDDLEFFGTIYVTNGNNTLTTGTGRTMGDGVYALTADSIGVNLTTFAPLSDPNDQSHAKAPGWDVAGSNNSPWRIGLDDAGNLLVTDWDDANGGIKWASRDLTTGGALLDQQEGPTFGVVNAFGDYIHGSIVSKPYSTGTIGVDLTVYAMDEDIESQAFVSADGNNVWRWDVGSETNYDGPNADDPDDTVPTLIIDPGNLVAGANLSPNVAAGSGTDSAGDDWFLNLNIGVLAETHFNEQHDNWYLLSPRDNGHDSSSIIITDAAAPETVLWSSKQFSIDNGLDGFIGDACDPALCGEVNDIFREAWAVDFSNDGSEMYVLMSFQYDTPGNTNPVIGPASPNGLDGHVLVIPLDENGLPDIIVNDNGTPGDTSDDFLENVTSIPVGTLDAGTIRVNLDVDAAGNVYVTSNISELMEIWSPGGSTIATTSWDGTTGSFVVTDIVGLTGDYNGDGKVDAADYVVWRKDPGSFGGAQGYVDWAANFGAMAGGGSSQGTGAVPEPGTLVLTAGLLVAAFAGRRRHAGRL